MMRSLDNRASVISLRFRSGKQFPRLTLHPPHFVKQGFTEPLFALGLSLGKCIGDVAFVAQDCSRGNRNVFRYVS
jgi:hypothetical protein